MPPEDLKVKSVVNFLTQDLTFDQLERLEKLVKLAIEGKINEEQFFRVLREPLYKGGVEVSSALAQEMTLKLKKILKEAIDVRRFRRLLSEKSQREEALSKQEKIIKKLRRSLLDEYSGDVTPIQVKRLEEAIKSRLSGEFQEKDFRKFLNLSFKKGGVGFKRRTAKRLSVLLEKLIAQSS